MKRSTFAFFVLTLFAGRDALACSCPQPGLPCQVAWRADAVFAGVVVSIEAVDNDSLGAPYQSKLVKVSVQRGFTNEVSGTVDVITGMGGGDCGYDFKEGERYLIYAFRSVSSGRLTASICSRTRLLSEAAEDLKYLGSPPPPGGGHVFGRIKEVRRHPAEMELVDYGPMDGVAVSLRGESLARGGITDANGRFDFTQLPVGKGVVTVAIPFGFEPRTWEQEFEIRDPRACAQFELQIQPAARASGVVVDASGRPVKDVMVDAVAAELAGFDPPQYQYAVRTNERGDFQFDALPPGEYVFGINLTNPGNGRPRAGGPLFMPGTRVASEAAVIELKAGDTTHIGTLQLPR